MDFSFIRKCNLRELRDMGNQTEKERERDNLDAFKKQLVTLSFV